MDDIRNTLATAVRSVEEVFADWCSDDPALRDETPRTRINAVVFHISVGLLLAQLC